MLSSTRPCRPCLVAWEMTLATESSLRKLRRLERDLCTQVRLILYPSTSAFNTQLSSATYSHHLHPLPACAFFIVAPLGQRRRRNERADNSAFSSTTGASPQSWRIGGSFCLSLFFSSAPGASRQSQRGRIGSKSCLTPTVPAIATLCYIWQASYLPPPPA